MILLNKHLSRLSTSLGTKYILVVASVLSVTMSINAYYSIEENRKLLTKHILTKASLLGRIISLSAPEAILKYDFYNLNEYAKNISEQNDIVYCAIADTKGRFITSYYDKRNPYIADILKNTQKLKIDILIQKLDIKKEIIQKRTNIFFNNNYLGEVIIGVSYDSVKEKLSILLKREFVTNIIIIILLVFLMHLIFKRSTLLRIQQIKKTSDEVRRGNFLVRAPVSSNDELTSLANSFNIMIDKLYQNISLKEDSLKQISKLNYCLEDIVQERTKALQESYDKLNHQQTELQNHRDNLEILVKEQTIDLVKSRDSAHAANHAKSDFLANMSHELRTPMHAILSYARFGVNKINNMDKLKLVSYFEKIEASGYRLLSLLNNLLDLAKLESGNININFQTHDITDLLHTVIDELSLLINEKKLTLQYQNETRDTTLIMDSEKIGQVIRNLLSNAIKFSDMNNKIIITIKDSTVNSGNLQNFGLLMSIEDQGLGIPENELDTVFNKFIQSSKTKTGAGGTGLGLAICQEIINAHFGNIWAENCNNTGAKFSFVIPKIQTIIN